MPQVSPSVHALPAAAQASLRQLGADLAMARKRRKQSLKAWALRLQVSVPTLMKLEKGDPTVSAGIYATALWMLNRHAALATLADPKEDLAALQMDIQRATQRHKPQESRIG